MSNTAPLGSLIYNEWTVVESSFDPALQHARETVFTIGNGYLGTRGSFEEGYPQSIPVTLVHGVFDAVPIVYTELANCPDWLSLVIVIEGDRFRLDQGRVLYYQRILDLEQGILRRSIHWQSPKGHTVGLTFERFASLADRHVLGLQVQIQALDFAGPVEVQASLSGYPENQGFNHWEILEQGAEPDMIWLHTRTRETRLELAVASHLVVTGSPVKLQASNVPGYPTLVASFDLEMGQMVTVEKLTTLFTTVPHDSEAPLVDAKARIATLNTYADLRASHAHVWHEVWDACDIVIEGDVTAQLATRYNLFQLLICGSMDNDRVSIAAKTLSGFGYRGHVFWDTEIFILPFFIFTRPAIARNLLSYRYHTLPGARRKALHYGYNGAMYAWESAATGDEVTPRWAALAQPYAEDIRIWCRDLEIHISSDVVYSIWMYWHATGDDPWMRDYGAEIILDTAVFWMSRVELNPKNGEYEILDVIGADEYHEHVNNNVFTNRMTQWHLERALIIYKWLAENYPAKATELVERLEISQKVRSRWQDIADNLRIHYDPATHLIEQFDGFFSLEEVDLPSLEPRHQSMQALLGIEGANAHQVLKQPDVLMLLYLMRESQEFPYRQDILQANWDYYAPRTDITHGSSLGPAIHGILACDLGLKERAYDRFLQAALVDLADLRGNSDQGIHGAAAGGVWQAVVFGFGGVKFTSTGPEVKPQLPPGWKRLSFKVQWQGSWHQFDLTPTQTQHRVLEAAPAVTPILYAQEYPMTGSDRFDIQGVIFDLDGVITDTAEFHYQAWQHLADEEGLPFDREANEALRGVSRRDSLLHILGDRQVPEDKLQAMMARKNEFYIQLIQSMTPDMLLPGSLTFLEGIRKAGLKIALGSASKNAQTVIRRLGIAQYFDAIADGLSVERSKPAPDLFLHAAQLLGVQPQMTVVFEDAASGVEAALAAQMWAVGLGPTERVGAAHLVIPSLDQQYWPDIYQKLAERIQYRSAGASPEAKAPLTPTAIA